jgi:hypothetical protein
MTNEKAKEEPIKVIHSKDGADMITIIGDFPKLTDVQLNEYVKESKKIEAEYERWIE